MAAPCQTELAQERLWLVVPATPPVRVPARRLTGCVMENSNPSHSWSCAMETWLHASKGGCRGAGHHTDITVSRPCPAPGREWGPDLYLGRQVGTFHDGGTEPAEVLARGPLV